ncbi:MAG: restriction endonuclease subunit S [Chthoniobacterales bacterium]
MSFPRYPKYKESGVEWLGQVPEHWEVKRIGAVFHETSETGDDELPILSVSIHHGVSDREMAEEEMDRKMTRIEDRSKYLRVSPGDLVYNMMRAWQGGFGAVTVDGMVSPAYVVARPREPIQTSFVEKLLRTPKAVEEMRRHSKGITDFRLRLYWEEFKNISIPIPSENEVHAIANFLDLETAKIDGLITEQERLIDLLKEKRQAVISHAVTKGLNLDALMKDSGIEWFGEVPEHWEVITLKRIVSMKSGESITGNEIDEDGKYPVFGGNGLRGYTTSFTHDGEYVLIGRQGALCGNINYGLGKFYASEHAVVAKPLLPIITLWLGEMLHSMNLNQYSVSAAQPGLSVEVIGNLRTIFPPHSEQTEIAGFLGRETAKFDTLTSEAQKAISLLQERRSALISAAVTGQIDVRGILQKAA